MACSSMFIVSDDHDMIDMGFLSCEDRKTTNRGASKETLRGSPQQVMKLVTWALENSPDLFGSDVQGAGLHGMPRDGTSLDLCFTYG